MADTPTIGAVIGLPPDATVRAFDARQEPRLTAHWSEMWEEDHARAFTVAKVAKLDLLQEIQSSLADVLANGGTFDQWRANLQPYLEKQGWWGAVQDKALTGTNDVVNVGPRRLRTIYDTNLRVSRAAGQWTRIQALKGERPFLRYTAVLDSRTRPAHRAFHGTILPVDHPWWNTHFPPCGWFCRCTTRQLSQRDLDAKGWAVTAHPPTGPAVPFYRAGSSTPVMVPAGISPGFGYNAGKASMAAIADKAAASVQAMASTDLAAARATVDELVQSDAFPKALADREAAIPVMVLDPALSDAIDATTQVVRLSSDTYAKQQGETDRSKGHPELTLDDYRQLPGMGAAPDEVLQQGDDRLLLLRVDDDRWRVAVVKATADRSELYLTSFRWANARTVAQLRKANPKVDW